MSRENVEVVRRLYDAFLNGDAAGALEALDPHVQWDLTRHEWPGEDLYIGHAGVIDVLAEWISGFADYRLEVRQVRDAGERVFVIQHEAAVHRESELAVERDTAAVCSVHGGRVTRIEHYLDPTEALEAVGLRE